MNASNDCDWVGEVMPEFLAGRISAEDDARVRAHLEGCSDCRKRSNAVSVLQQTPVPIPDPDRWDHFVSGVVEAAEHERRKQLPIFVWAAVVALLLTGSAIFTWSRISGWGERGDREEVSIEVLAREVAELPPAEAALWTVGVGPMSLLPADIDLTVLTEDELERLLREVERT